MGGGIILNIVLTEYLYPDKRSGIHGGGVMELRVFMFGFFITLIFYFCFAVMSSMSVV